MSTNKATSTPAETKTDEDQVTFKTSNDKSKGKTDTPDMPEVKSNENIQIFGDQMIDLGQLNKEELAQLVTATNQAIRDWDTKRKTDALNAARALVAQYGYDMSDILTPSGKLPGHNAGKKIKTSKSGPPKYRNPTNPDETWTGHGRRPKWVLDYVAEGNELTNIEIAA
jgi:DNA-binding protein H-NS